MNQAERRSNPVHATPQEIAQKRLYVLRGQERDIMAELQQNNPFADGYTAYDQLMADLRAVRAEMGILVAGSAS